MRVGPVRAPVDEVLAGHSEHGFGADLSLTADHDAAVRRPYDLVAGSGPFQRDLDDPEIEEIWINERLTPGSVGAG